MQKNNSCQGHCGKSCPISDSFLLYFLPVGFLLPAQRILSAGPEASVMVASINKLPLRSRSHPASPSAPLIPLPPRGGWGRALEKVPQGCWPLCEVSCLTNLCWEHSDGSGNGCAVERGSLKRTLFLNFWNKHVQESCTSFPCVNPRPLSRTSDGLCGTCI